jgi:serine/threonine protein kinase
MVAEYCLDGDYRKTLSAYRLNPPPVEAVIRDAEQILQGLKVLHSKIVHRDLKPENVLRIGDTLKVADFGLARFVDLATRTLTFKGSGTPLYMAPETWMMKRATPATDLYALGVMLFEALAGEAPFPPTADIFAIRDHHLYTPVPRVKSKNALVQDFLDGVIKKLLVKEPAQRYQSAEEVIVALKSLGGPGPSAEVVQIATNIRKQHDMMESRTLDESRRQEDERAEQAKIAYMEKEVIDLIDEVISEVNANLVETKIGMTSLGRDRSYHFAGRTLRLHFFEPGEMFRNPEVPGRMDILHKRHVVHGGFIEIQEGGQDREGWNLVLVRPPESMYGEWRIVETKSSPLSGHRFRYEPSATEARLFADNLACHWMPAMHSFMLGDRPFQRSDVFNILGMFIPK